MIEFSQVTVTYPDAARPTLSDVSLLVEEGELCLVAGEWGGGWALIGRSRLYQGILPLRG